MQIFGSVCADRSVSGPGCLFVTYYTKKAYASRPSANDFTAWHRGPAFRNVAEAKACLKDRYVTDIEERF